MEKRKKKKKTNFEKISIGSQGAAPLPPPSNFPASIPNGINALISGVLTARFAPDTVTRAYVLSTVLKRN